MAGTALIGNRLYVPSDKGMYALNAITGTLVWHVLAGSTFYASPAVTGPPGRLVLVDADNAGHLYVLNPATGAVVDAEAHLGILGLADRLARRDLRGRAGRRTAQLRA